MEDIRTFLRAYMFICVWARCVRACVCMCVLYSLTFKCSHGANAFLGIHSGGPTARISEALNGMSCSCFIHVRLLSLVTGQIVMSEESLSLLVGREAMLPG